MPGPPRRADRNRSTSSVVPAVTRRHSGTTEVMSRTSTPRSSNPRHTSCAGFGGRNSTKLASDGKARTSSAGELGQDAVALPPDRRRGWPGRPPCGAARPGRRPGSAPTGGRGAAPCEGRPPPLATPGSSRSERPARAKALENVRTTTTFGQPATSPAADRPPNSTYASSTTTSASPVAASPSTTSTGCALPVGLFGEHTKTTAGSAARARATSCDEMTHGSSMDRGNSSPCVTHASRSWRRYVGSNTTTRRPGPP